MGKKSEEVKKGGKKDKKQPLWKKYWIKDESNKYGTNENKNGRVDMATIRRKWLLQGREVANRLRYKKKALKNSNLSVDDKEKIKAETDSWCRQVYTEVARDIGHKPSQFPPYQVINGSNHLGTRLADLTYSFGRAGRVHYTLGGLLERCISMRRAEYDHMKKKRALARARALRKKEREERRAEPQLTGESDEYEDEEEEEEEESDDDEWILDLDEWDFDDDEDEDEGPKGDDALFKHPDCLRAPLTV